MTRHDEEVSELQQLLEELRIVKVEQENLKEELLHIKTELKQQRTGTPVKATSADESHIEERRPLTIEDIEVGDRVVIRNPRANQDATGTIIGFTPTGQVRIKTANRPIIRRIPSNLEKVTL